MPVIDTTETENHKEEFTVYMTEYSRGQLPKKEIIRITEHLENCNKCQKELKRIERLTEEMDKLIPSVSKQYEQELIYKIFIKAKHEPLIVRIMAAILVIAFIIFIFNTISIKIPDYVSLYELKTRAENMFDESFYSEKKNNEN